MSLEIALERIQEAEKSNALDLDLSELKLREIPKEISKLTQLTHLVLSDNEITGIKGLERLTKLTFLDLSSNQIDEIKGLEQLTQLFVLNLSNNELTEIKGLENLINLADITLNKNQITQIKGLEKLNNLSILNLSTNQITEIKGLEKLVKLSNLNLTNNQLTEIKGLERLNKLSTLYLSYNKLTELKGFEHFRKLLNLFLDSNQITKIRGLEKLNQLAILNLSNNKLKEINGLEKLIQLSYLNLESNKLTEIKGLENLKKLTKLILFNNKIKEIKGLEKLTLLDELWLGKNRLKEIKGLEKNVYLTKLSLWGNQIKELKGLEKLAELDELILSGNHLTEINGLEKLEKLTLLNLMDNHLTEFPEYLLGIGKTICWETEIDGDFIEVGGNPFTNPPTEIIKQGNKAIQEYFDQRRKTGEVLLNEAKLILLGDGRSGKTSLANRLLGKELPKEADRTPGVDIIIGDYGFPLANGKDFKINIWDFAGQDKYKTLHQLFYTESSLYVMVAESGNMSTDFDDWFQTAALFGEGSPLILVLNEFKEGIGMGSFDTTYWKKQFPDLLKEVYTVNLLTNQNFNTIENYIQLLAQTLPHTKYSLPSNWAAIRKVLNDRRNEQFITLKDYFEICKNNNLPERESSLILSSILHKVGDCLHYQKSEILNQFVILKNEWATDAVYKILDDKIVAEQKCGFFDKFDMERIWSSNEYIDMRPQLLELMKQFKLAYQLPGKEEFITPPLLPPGRPADFVWPELDSLELYIEYEFIPKALLTQFIVTRHTDIAKGRTLVWRHGVVLQWDSEALAEISKTKVEGKDAFYIHTQGNKRKEMMTVILKTFRDLHAEYKGIKYKEKVPCICEGCRAQKNKQYYFDFENLNFRLEKGRLEVECDYSLKTVNILKLLDNTFVFENYKEGQVIQLKEKVNGENSSGNRILKIFLASSKELIEEREKIEQALSRKNKSLRKQGFFIELLIWEDGKHIGNSLRSQNNYNLEIEQCNLFAMLFYSKVGKYTLEEFEKAKSLFEKEEKMPRICIFQKHNDIPKNQSEEDAVSRFNFLKRLKELSHFPTLFDNTDKLINELEDAIDKLLQDEDFLKRLQVE